MHYALPQRKSSHPPAYAIKPKKSLREQRRLFAIIGVGALALIFLLYRLLSPWSSEAGEIPSKAPYGQPGVVVVTTINPSADPDFVEKIKANRIEYATKHGYATFFPNTTQYSLRDSPKSWARVPAMRHALNQWPQTPYFFHIDDRTLIMNTDIKIEDQIMNKKKLEKMMLVDIPIIPPDSVIKTFGGLKGDKIDLVICQDKDGLMPNAFILRRGEWANFFLDVWFDPLYRSYNFQKAERHALEHIVQWHGTILSKIALIPQNVLTSYIEKEAEIASDNGIYRDGDFTLFFGDCNKGGRSCVSEMKPYFAKLFAKEKSDLGPENF